MDRVEVIQGVFAMIGMRVCAVADATDEEILAACNSQNTAGTQSGWTTVVRASEGDDSMFAGPNKVPKQCAEYGDRMHFVVLC